MRIAVVSDIHGNLTAFEAVLADLRETSPDLIFHGGDLADNGSRPVEVLDRIRGLGWPGVLGNTDEMLARPESLEEFAARTPPMQPLLPPIREMAAWARQKLGEERLAFLRALPAEQLHLNLALVHASPGNPWRAPAADAQDADLESAYGSLGRQIVVYGHIHKPYIRQAGTTTIVNSGSVSLSYDGDRRASYLLIDDGKPGIRRVEYDVPRECKALERSRLPHWDWIARSLTAAQPQMP